MAEPSYTRRLFARAFRETKQFTQHKLLTGAAVAIATVIARLALWRFHQITLAWADVWINLLIIAGSFVIVLLGAFIVNLFRATALLDRERSRTAERGDGELAEEDPKVHLVPLNGEFVGTGLIPFDLFNEGQRVNPAYRITVQPIPMLPSVSFEYVDHLQINQHKKIVPVVRDAGPFARTNILPELEKAWEGVCKSTGQHESELSELTFEIKINYEDANGTRKFETSIKLSYSLARHLAAANHATTFRTDSEIIKVMRTDFRRFS
jgi:hypothetical protein